VFFSLVQQQERQFIGGGEFSEPESIVNNVNNQLHLISSISSHAELKSYEEAVQIP